MHFRHLTEIVRLQPISLMIAKMQQTAPFLMMVAPLSNHLSHFYVVHG